MNLIVENKNTMPLNFYMNIYADLLIRWWKVGVGIVGTWATALFGGSVLLFITPEVSDILKIAIPFLATAWSAIWTGIIAWKRGVKEMDRMEQDDIQDRQDYFESKMRYLIEIGEIPEGATLEEKVAITRAYIEALKN